MDVTNKLNEKLHRVETLYEQAKSKKLIDVNDIGRMKDCFENLISMEEDRQTKGGGYLNLPTRLKSPNNLSYANKQLYDTLCRYKDLKDQNDSALRQRLTSQVDDTKVFNDYQHYYHYHANINLCMRFHSYHNDNSLCMPQM